MELSRALIVEDDPKFRVLLRRVLEKKFHMIVLEAYNGIHGLEVYQREKSNLDIIFLDIAMPFMNGIEFLQNIRMDDKATPVIVMTCMSDKESVQSMIGLGINEYILKSDIIINLTPRIELILHKTILPKKSF